MKTLILLVILNLPDGTSQEIAVARGLDFPTCNAMQQAVWAAGSPVAYVDDQGPVPAIDAACVYPVQLSRSE